MPTLKKQNLYLFNAGFTPFTQVHKNQFSQFEIKLLESLDNCEDAKIKPHKNRFSLTNR